MNEQLKFTWGHIIAFLALIFISYVSFMGITYLTDGDFIKAMIGVLFIIVMILLVFIGAQILKSTEKGFRKKIWIERFCIFTSPIVFILLMIPYTHFWTVYNNKSKIVSQFTTAVNTSKKMFEDYDKYSINRIENYDKMLERIIKNKRLRKKEYMDCGFNGIDDKTQKKNKVEALKLQLRSENYDSLKTVAVTWIDNASGASVWNVFLLGNIKQIKSSINDWYKTLVVFSENEILDEEYKGYNTVLKFDPDSETIKAAETGLNSLNNLYTQRSGPSMIAIISIIICYLLLLFPYILQDRHTKSTYRLLGKEKEIGDVFFNHKINFSSKSHRQPSSKSSKQDDDIIIESYDEEYVIQKTDSPIESNDNDDYKSFTL